LQKSVLSLAPLFRPGVNDPGYVRLKACWIGEVEVLFRYTLSGL
jgi:hypothetical protein